MLVPLAFALAAAVAAASKPTPSVLFEPNRGQAPDGIAFLARGTRSSLELAADGGLAVVLAGEGGRQARITITPVGADTPRYEPLERQAAVLNILRGRDPAAWQRGLPLYARVRAVALYPGVDVVFYGNGPRAEYDYVVAPGARPSMIRLRIGGGSIRRAEDGALSIAADGGEIRQPKPVAYQMIDGARHPVDVAYVVDRSTVGFATGPYDPARPLVIDPLLVTSTFTGGTRTVNDPYVAFSADGLYLTGFTSGTDGSTYVAKYAIDGRTLLFETIYGGERNTIPAGIGVDANGRIYIAGTTYANDLPSAGRQLQGWRGPLSDGFLATFAADGASLVLSTYIGSDGDDSVTAMGLGSDWYVGMRLGGPTAFAPPSPANAAFPGSFVARLTLDARPLRLQQTGAVAAVALGPDGAPYLGGTDGPTTAEAFQSTPGQSTCTEYHGVGNTITRPCHDGWVAHYSRDLSTLVWGTLLRETVAQPTEAEDLVTALAVDPTGAVAVFGATLSASFPVTAGAFETVCTPCTARAPLVPQGVPFVARLDATGRGLIFSTFLGGTSTHGDSDSHPERLALDRLGNLVVVGRTTNAAFPVAGPQLPHAPAGSPDDADMFVSVFAPTGSLTYSSRLGGSTGFGDWAHDVAVSRYGTTAVAGVGDATFPLKDPTKSVGPAGSLSILSFPRIETRLDAPDGLTRAAAVTVRGWAVDTTAASGPGIDRVDVTATPTAGGAPLALGAATLGGTRADVALALGDPTLTTSGFTLTTSLPPGAYTISAIAHSAASNQNGSAATAHVTALTGTVARIQTPAAGTLPSRILILTGFAADLDAPAGTGVDAVHVWAWPASGPPFFLGVASYGDTRDEVTAMFGAQFTQSGFSLTVNNLPPGIYTVSAHAHSTVTGTFAAVDAVSLVVPPIATELHVDVPSGPALYPGFTIGGWAADTDAPDVGSGVDAIHVWARPLAGGNPIFLGSTTTFVARPDVAAARGARFLLSGFTIKTASVPPGAYEVATYAHSAQSQQFEAVDVRRLTVLAVTGPVFAITNIPDGSRVNGALTLTGYAFDPRAASGLGIDAIHMYLYADLGSGTPPQFMGLAGYGDGGDPTVGARFGAQFSDGVVRATMTLPPRPGTHVVALFAHSSVDDSFTLITRVVTVPPAQVLMSIDLPRPNATVTPFFTLGGWAIDRAGTDVPGDTSGIEFLQIYAVPVAGGPAVFLCGPGAPSAPGAVVDRPDVAAMFGARFLHSGFECGQYPEYLQLPSGTYDLVVYALSARTRQYSPPAIVRFTVQ